MRIEVVPGRALGGLTVSFPIWSKPLTISFPCKRTKSKLLPRPVQKRAVNAWPSARHPLRGAVARALFYSTASRERDWLPARKQWRSKKLRFGSEGESTAEPQLLFYLLRLGVSFGRGDNGGHGRLLTGEERGGPHRPRRGRHERQPHPDQPLASGHGLPRRPGH